MLENGEESFKMASQTDLLTYLLTPRSSPSREANRFTATQEIPLILWNLKVHYHIHKCMARQTSLITVAPVSPAL